MSRAIDSVGRAVGALLVSLSAGCAVVPAECDPALADVSFWVKANCLYTGEYDRREQAKRDALEEELRLKSLFEETYAALKAEQARIDDQNSAGRMQLDQVSRSVSSLQDALQEKRANDKKLDQQIVQLKIDMQKMQEQPGQSPVQQRQALSELMVKIGDLQQSLELR